MTTSPVMTVTDELLAEIEVAADKATKGSWCTDCQAWVCAADSDQLNAGFVISICDGPDDLKNADYIAKAGPQTIGALIIELRRLRAENAELAKDAGRYRWLRDGAGYCDTRDIPGMAPLRMDEYIDTAMERPQ